MADHRDVNGYSRTSVLYFDESVVSFCLIVLRCLAGRSLRSSPTIFYAAIFKLIFVYPDQQAGDQMKNRSTKNSRDRRQQSKVNQRIVESSTDQTPRYVAFEHPDNLFHIDYPAHWKIEFETAPAEATNFVCTTHDDVGATAFRMPMQYDVREIVEDERVFDAFGKMLESVGSVNPRRDPNVAYPCMTADRAEPNQVGQRWVVAHCDVMLCVSVSCPEDVDHIYRPIFERMLSSLRIKRETEALFVRMYSFVMQRIKEELPDVKWKQDGLSLKTDRVTMSMQNLFTSVRSAPHDLERLAEEFVGGIVSVMSQPQIGKELWSNVRHKILPILKPEAYLHEATAGRLDNASQAQRDLSQLVSTPWLTNLHICYAIDNEKTFRFLVKSDLDSWGVDAEKIHSTAIKNLTAGKSSELFVMKNPVGEGGVGMMTKMIGAASSYLLHPKLFELASRDLGRDLMAAIPSRDALVIFGNSSAAKHKIADQVRLDYQQSVHSLSDRIFRLTPDGVGLA